MGDETLVHAACPHDCPDNCAMVVTVRDGIAVKVAGDPDHPITAGTLCAKVNDYVDRVYSPERLLRPLIRSGPKGTAAFREATWDEAVGLVAERLLAVRDEFGGEAIMPYSYLGTMGLVQGDVMSARVMHALGATECQRTICADGGLMGMIASQGLSPEVDPERWPNARYIVVWAWNPLSTAPHLWRMIQKARKNGARLVVVDPYRSRTARVADEHVQPMPGSDAALALGMMRAIVDAGLQDEEWCRAHTSGYDELLARLDEWPVDRAADACEVDAAVIRRLGEEFASTQPSLLRLGVGGQRHLGAPSAYHAVSCIPALAGSWRHDGGGCSYIPTATITRARNTGSMRRSDLQQGSVRTINMSAIGDALTDAALEPPVKAFVCWNSNPARIAPDAARVRDGLARDDLFTVVLEHFMTDTARFADVVLPVTTQLEHLDSVGSWGHHYLAYNEPAIAPVGETKPNTEVFRLLAAALGFDDPCFSQSDGEMLDEALALAGDVVDATRLRAQGWVKIDLGQGPTPHAEGGFGTGDGKLAFQSEFLGMFGKDKLPSYDPPAEIADAALAQRFPYALLTPKTHFFLNSTFANHDRQRTAQGGPFVAVHPADAAVHGITDGQPVRVWNDRGEFVVPAHVSDDVRPGVLVAPMGWWGRDHADELGPQATTSQRLTTIGDAPIFNDNRVALEPVTG